MTKLQTLQYRIVYLEGNYEIVQVEAATINAGFPKAYAARMHNHEIARIEFWQVLKGKA